MRMLLELLKKRIKQSLSCQDGVYRKGGKTRAGNAVCKLLGQLEKILISQEEIRKGFSARKPDQRLVRRGKKPYERGGQKLNLKK